MEVILLKQVKGKGQLGDKIQVKLGYARYLISNKVALAATPSNIKRFNDLKNKELKAIESTQKEFELIAEKISGKTVEVVAKTQNGKLFGSVTPTEVVKELEKAFEVKVSKSALQMPAHIKEVGKSTISVDLHPNVKCDIHLSVKGDEVSPEEEISEEALAEKVAEPVQTEV